MASEVITLVFASFARDDFYEVGLKCAMNLSGIKWVYVLGRFTSAGGVDYRI